MTERLYYTDCCLTEFEATVVSVRKNGDRTGVVLDRTAFYPTSGGQPFDTGTLGAARVIDVVEDEDGAVVHVIDGDPPAGLVTGRVQWARRFEHMQQHTGQHVLSAAFDRTIGVPTVSFHLGSVASTIDLAREVTAAEVAKAENAANEVVWEDRPVTIRFADASEAAPHLRKESSRTGQLRIVEIDRFDVSACGGTHVSRTGAIGSIVVSARERFKGGSRIEFRCGVRALADYRRLRDAVGTTTRLLSTSVDELGQSVERLQAENRDLRKRSKDLEGSLAMYEADALTSRATPVGAFRVVAEALPERDLNALKTIAQRIAATAGHAAILVTGAAPCSVVITRAADVKLDSAAVLKELLAQFGGKGGGRPEMAQGGGLNAPAEQVLDRARAIISRVV